MPAPRFFAIGGFVAGFILIASGVGSAFIGYQGRAEVRDTLRAEGIVAPQDSTIPGQLVDTGDEARAQAAVIRMHQLERTGGLTYAQMGRFALPDGDPKGTNVAAEAAVGANGNPAPNVARDSWVTATTLITALETAFFAEQVGNFAILMGMTLMLTGVGLVVLVAAAILRMPAFEAHKEQVPAGQPAAA